MKNEFYGVDYSKLIDGLRKTNFNISICVTGGGTGFITELLQHGGMSDKVYDVQIPYSQRALENFLRCKPKTCCSQETALEMARMTFSENCSVTAETNIIGLGLTCSLAKHENEREGRENVAYLAIVSIKKIIELSFDMNALSKNETLCFCHMSNVTTRQIQEDLISSITIKALADFLNVEYDEKLVMSTTYGTPTPA